MESAKASSGVKQADSGLIVCASAWRLSRAWPPRDAVVAGSPQLGALVAADLASG